MRHFNPQKSEELRARYPKALEWLFDWNLPGTVESLPDGPPEDNVFDFENGMRLIVTRDLEADGTVWLHLSVGVQPGTPLYEAIRRGEVKPLHLSVAGRMRYVYLSGDRTRWDSAEMSAKALYFRRKVSDGIAGG